jgi:hypothetical protein
MTMTTDLVQRETLTARVGTYQQAVSAVEQAYSLLNIAQQRLKSAFTDGSFDVIRRNSYNGPTPEEAAKVIEDLKRQAWRVIVDRLEIRRILSIKRREDLDKQLYESRDAQPLPEITEAAILSMLQDGMAKAADYAREAVFEVFDWLRPHYGHTSDLKTNEKWRIGKKVIIGWMVEPGWGRGGKFRVRYNSEKNLTALDNVFHMLDGRGPLKTHHGPLYDAIAVSEDGTGETDFFKFKCCKNNNLHLEFKRPDLVQKINAMAGGNRLKGGA